jgi:hypothetical protein
MRTTLPRRAIDQADVARHVIEYHVTQETRVKHASDEDDADAAGNVWWSLPLSLSLSSLGDLRFFFRFLADAVITFSFFALLLFRCEQGLTSRFRRGLE